MGTHTTVMIQKQGGTIRNDLPPTSVQIDTLSQQEAAYYGGAAPYFRYSIYVEVPNSLQDGDIEQRDLLLDDTYIDQVTGTKRMYRIISDPEPFSDGHVEMVADRYRGT